MELFKAALEVLGQALIIIAILWIAHGIAKEFGK